jgi:hypothetical protein
MLEIIEIDGKGFNVLKDYKCWRIAQLGYDTDTNSIEGVKTFGRHLETDEVFVLLEGEAFIFTRGFDDAPKSIEVQKMDNNKLYTVKERQWHTAVLMANSRVLIIENNNTGSLNSQDYKIDEVELEIMKKLIKAR